LRAPLVYDAQGDYEEALELHGKAIRIDDKVYQPNHPHFLQDHANAKATYEKSGRAESFETWLAEVLSQEEQ